MADTLPPFRDRISKNTSGRAWGTARFHQLHPSQPVHGYTCAHVFCARICTGGDCEQIRQRDVALIGGDHAADGGWQSTQGQLQAMDETAAHHDGCSASRSKTMRTARSRTSGENLLVVMLISARLSHELEPPVFASSATYVQRTASWRRRLSIAPPGWPACETVFPSSFFISILLIGLNAAIYDAI